MLVSQVHDKCQIITNTRKKSGSYKFVFHGASKYMESENLTTFIVYSVPRNCRLKIPFVFGLYSICGPPYQIWAVSFSCHSDSDKNKILALFPIA